MEVQMSVEGDGNTMLIQVAGGKFCWRDSTGTEHRAETLLATTHCGEKRIEVMRTGTALRRARIGYMGGRHIYSGFDGVPDSDAGDRPPYIKADMFEAGDRIRILNTPPAERDLLWRIMQTPE